MTPDQLAGALAAVLVLVLALYVMARR